MYNTKFILKSVSGHITDAKTYANLALTCKAVRSEMCSAHCRHASFMEGNRAMQAIFDEGRNILLTGGAGVGKSYTLNRIVREGNRRGWSVAVTSTTGMASTQLDGAMTLHRWAGIGFARQTAKEMAKLRADGHRIRANLKVWRETHMLVIDEVSMMSDKIIDILQFVSRLSDAEEKTDMTPFQSRRAHFSDGFPDRIILVLCGDFYQLPPVGGKYTFCSPGWGVLNLLTVTLTAIVRQSDDLQYASMLQRLRVGKATERDLHCLKQRLVSGNQISPIPEGAMVKKRKRKDETKPAKRRRQAFFVSPSVFLENSDFSFCPVHMLPNHVTVKFINENFFNALKGEVLRTSIAEDEVYRHEMRVLGGVPTPMPVRLTPAAQNAVLNDPELTSILKHLDSICPPVINYKNNCQYIITRNIDQQAGVVNGLRCILKNNELWALEAPGSSRLKKLDVPMRKWAHTVALGNGLFLRRTQDPLRLGYAITIHASQGMTLDEAYVDLSSTFAPGQGYVAISRVGSLGGLHLLGFKKNSFNVSKDVEEFYDSL